MEILSDNVIPQLLLPLNPFTYQSPLLAQSPSLSNVRSPTISVHQIVIHPPPLVSPSFSVSTICQLCK